MTDPAFAADMTRVGMFLLAALLDALLWRRSVGRLPPQQPGDVAGLGRTLATIGCAGGLGLVLMCAVASWVILGWGRTF